MLFGWFAAHRRKQILEQPFPNEWLEILERNMPVYARLTPDEQARLRDDLRIFLAEKSWEGCGGLKLTDEVRVTISAQACLLTLHRRQDYFPNVESILVYPIGYRAPTRKRDPSGVVSETVDQRLGEVWSNNRAVILSWDDARTGGLNPEDGRNVVYHEFAHKLDATDREMNGVPLLDDNAQVETWANVMRAEYDGLIASIQQGLETLLDPYAATNAAEFFAVATECFFEKPVQMRDTHSDLYRLLQGYYRQDPAARVAAQAG